MSELLKDKQAVCPSQLSIVLIAELLIQMGKVFAGMKLVCRNFLNKQQNLLISSLICLGQSSLEQTVVLQWHRWSEFSGPYYSAAFVISSPNGVPGSYDCLKMISHLKNKLIFSRGKIFLFPQNIHFLQNDIILSLIW